MRLVAGHELGPKLSARHFRRNLYRDAPSLMRFGFASRFGKSFWVGRKSRPVERKVSKLHFSNAGD